MTYLSFHLLFTIPLFVLCLLLNRKNPLFRSQRGWLGAGLLLFLAISYTTPWDSFLIAQEIWTYSPERVLGSFLLIPYEEYFFFIIQTLIGCLITGWFLRGHDKPQVTQLAKSNGLAMITLFSLWVIIAFSVPQNSQFNYLWLIAVWSFPILALQLALGFQLLFKFWKIWLGTVVGLTLYFWVADSVAIHNQIWQFPENTISGYEIGGILPIEEALFFLVTNLMVVQGYLLFTQIDFAKSFRKKKAT